MKKWWFQRIMLILFLSMTILGCGFGMEQYQEEEENRQVSIGSVENSMVIPGGMPIGIYMEMDGILVLGTDSIECVDGNEYEPAKNLVKAGDYIVGMNGENINTKKELVRAVGKLETAEVILTLRRGEEYIDVKMESVEVGTDKYKLGIWVKDNVQGLGTVTYVTLDGEFGALGHGIHDADTEDLLEISEGTVYETSIVGIQKGKKGEPGGLEGVIIYNKYNEIGDIVENTENGVFGKITNPEDAFDLREPVAICKKENVELGKATILCTLDNEVKEYEIEIKNVDSYAKEANKELVIEITDKELIKETGGIVQGFSGSPILQNNKIVGAVTHVLVNDPTRGYGIFIEDMLNQ